MSRSLPEGWQELQLGEVCQIIMGQSPPGTTYNSEGIGLPFFQGKTDFGSKYPIPTAWCTQPLKIANEGDILISVRAPVGATNIATDECCIGRGVGAIRPLTFMDRDFVREILQFNQAVFEKYSSGSTFSAINKDTISRIGILSPPLPEQQKIAEILSSVDAAIDATRAVITQARRTQKALMEELLTKGLPGKGVQHWKPVLVDDILVRIDAGKSPNCEGRPASFDEWAVLKVSAISWEEFKPQENKVLPKLFQPIPALEVKPDDLLISRANGQRELVGAITLVKKTRDKLMLSDKTLRLVPDESLILKEFLLYSFRSKRTRKLLMENGTGKSTSMNNITQAQIRNIDIKLPPLNEQTIISSLLAANDNHRQTESLNLEILQNLKSALMQVLLTGEKRVVLTQPEAVAV